MAKKGIAIPNTNLMVVGIGYDTNGNKIVKLKGRYASRGFSIQTNGNLPKVAAEIRGLKNLPETLTLAALAEIKNYVSKHGSETQKGYL